jgi:hypothetical protein
MRWSPPVCTSARQQYIRYDICKVRVVVTGDAQRWPCHYYWCTREFEWWSRVLSVCACRHTTHTDLQGLLRLFQAFCTFLFIDPGWLESVSNCCRTTTGLSLFFLFFFPCRFRPIICRRVLLRVGTHNSVNLSTPPRTPRTRST